MIIKTKYNNVIQNEIKPTLKNIKYIRSLDNIGIVTIDGRYRHMNLLELNYTIDNEEEMIISKLPTIVFNGSSRDISEIETNISNSIPVSSSIMVGSPVPTIRIDSREARDINRNNIVTDSSDSIRSIIREHLRGE